MRVRYLSPSLSTVNVGSLHPSRSALVCSYNLYPFSLFWLKPRSSDSTSLPFASLFRLYLATSLRCSDSSSRPPRYLAPLGAWLLKSSGSRSLIPLSPQSQ